MKKTYEKPQIQIEALALQDVIASSAPPAPIEHENIFIDFDDFF